MAAKISEGKRGGVSPKSSEGNWFLIMVSWEENAVSEAIERFYAVYRYLFALGPPDAISAEMKEKIKPIPLGGDEDPRNDIVKESLKPLNLTGERKFVIILQIRPGKSNRVLQELSARITLNAPITVKIFPATYVHDLIGILPLEKNLDLRSKWGTTKLR